MIFLHLAEIYHIVSKSSTVNDAPTAQEIGESKTIKPAEVRDSMQQLHLLALWLFFSLSPSLSLSLPLPPSLLSLSFFPPFPSHVQGDQQQGSGKKSCCAKSSN